MTSKEIIKRAKKYTHSALYVYWFGGKDERCTQNLLNTLSSLYPKIYTPAYIAACKTDIRSGKKCIDCSGLVCAAYNKPMVGTSQFYKTFKEWRNTPKDGMIVWTKNHCGIYNEGKIIEARGRFVGITDSRPYISGQWKIMYDPDVAYISDKNETSTVNYNKVVEDVIAGKYGNGAVRKQKLAEAGYDYNIVQKLVNSKLKASK